MTHIITRLGHHGDGIAAGPIYAPLTLPGEEITGDVVNGRISAPRIVTPSPDRVRPVCRHFKTCGGCALQHGSDAFVAGWKQDVVAQALAAQGIEAPFHPIVTSPSHSRRRATFSARRSKKGVIAGFHARASDTVLDITECPLLLPEVLAALPAVREICAIGGSRKGEIKATATASQNGLDMAVTGGKPLDVPLMLALTALAGRFHLARLSWDGELIVEHAPPTQRFGPAQVAPPAGAFLQATAAGEAALVAAVDQAIGPDAGRIVDLFAGCGTFSLPLATRADVHAVEGEAAMLAALDRGWRRTSGLYRVTTETRDLFRRPLLADELAAFDAAVIDPPRAGAEAQIAALAQSRLRRIAAVSCNPVTFARDAARLVAGGYTLDWVQVVDQFRWSPHIELAAQFTKTPG